MTTVTVSPKFQVVIPKAIREALEIKVGARLHAIQYQDRIELVPVRSARQARGIVKEIELRFLREKDRA